MTGFLESLDRFQQGSDWKGWGDGRDYRSADAARAR